MISPTPTAINTTKRGDKSEIIPDTLLNKLVVIVSVHGMMKVVKRKSMV
ncbi:hypothetical protein KW786_02045 [Candidatus Parcubacteria bacterium]|nr:hypothetical protein [Candidatus Parcubacteria bacterium]